MLCCIHKTKFNQDIYILGIIQTGLCYIMLLIIPSGLKASDPFANVFNSKKKVYQDDAEFQKECDLKTMLMVYKF